MLEVPGTHAAVFITGVALPLVLGMLLDIFGDSVWDGYQLYRRLDEYGEPKRWDQPVRTLLNSYTSFAFWTAGSVILVDGATRPRALLNCAAVVPQFNVLLGVACIWTAVASFAFHASLTEVWRILDAGATMGVAFLPAAASLYRLALSLIPGMSPMPFLVAGVMGNIGCHFLARTQGWSDIILPAAILCTIFIDFVLLAAFRTREDMWNFSSFAACALLGLLLRAADVKLHRHMPLIWLGHSCWHVLMSLAIVIAYEGSVSYSEPFCV